MEEKQPSEPEGAHQGAAIGIWVFLVVPAVLVMATIVFRFGTSIFDLAFTICWLAGGACCISWMICVFAAKSMRQPGISWWQANFAFDFSIYPPLSHFYTEEGIRALRRGRNFCLLWLLFWAIGVAIKVVPWIATHQSPA